MIIVLTPLEPELKEQEMRKRVRKKGRGVIAEGRRDREKDSIIF